MFSLLLTGCSQFGKSHQEQNVLFGSTVGTAWELLRGEDFGATYIGTAGGSLPKTGYYSFDSQSRNMNDKPAKGLEASVRKLDAEATQAVEKGLAVVEFDVIGDWKADDAGRMVGEWMVGALSRNGRFDLCERVLLKRVLDEQRLAVSGVQSNQAETARLGELYGVGVIVTGGVTRWGNSYSVSARLIDTTTGRIFRTAEDSTSFSKDLPGLVDRLALQLSAP